MSEIKTPLPKTFDDDGEPVYTIDQRHSFGDVIRHLISEGATLSDFAFVWTHRLEDAN